MKIKTFQELYYISQLPDSDFDKSIKLVGCILGKTPEEVENMNMLKFNALCRMINKKFEILATKFHKGKPRNVVFVRGRWYRLHYDVARHPHNAGKYVEAITFAKDVVPNLHKIMATMAEPINWLGKPYKRDHRDIAADMEHLDFEVAYHAAVFFYLMYKVSMKVSRPYLERTLTMRGMTTEAVRLLLDNFMNILDGLPTPKWCQNSQEYLSHRFGI